MALNWPKHKEVLLRILKESFNNRSLSPHLGFKGGTAAMLFHGLNRYSVDLDFDLIHEDYKELVLNTMRELLSQMGTLKKVDDKRYNLFFLLSYDGKVSGTSNIKVEINKRAFGSQYETLQYLGIPMRVMNQDDMFAHKLVALTERRKEAMRDVYDVHYFFKNHWPINKELVIRRTDMDYVSYLECCIERIEKVNNREVLSGLGELLLAKQKQWVKAHLKEDTLFLLRLAHQTAQAQEG